ncbi:MAG: hypothetical protein GKR89_29125 [Candidatus Latescibacteria bacterium]|nr:hypothetical protein [Candidatus Latescibacterota bacterium]
MERLFTSMGKKGLKGCCFVGLILISVWGGLSACGRPDGEVVALVGDRKIAGEALRQFLLNLPPGLRTDKEGQAAREDYLQTLIDQEMLLAEAGKRGLEQDPELLRQLAAKERDFAVVLYTKRHITPGTAVTDEEIRRVFDERDLGRERKLAAILVGTRAEAAQLAQRIAAGESFADLARTHSLDTRSGVQGGVLGYIDRILAERTGVPGAVFDTLAVGRVSPPIPRGKVFHLVCFLDERSADLSTYKDRLHALLRKEKQQALEAQQVELLGSQLGWQLQAGGLDLLRQQARAMEEGQDRPPLTAAQQQLALFDYDGGEITVGAYIHAVQLRRIRTLRAFADSQFIEGVGRRFLQPGAMLLEGARREGILDDPGMVAQLARVWNELLLTALRQQVVGPAEAVEEKAVEAYYKENRQLFRIPDRICFDEALTHHLEEAKELRRIATPKSDLLAWSRQRELEVRSRGPDSLACLTEREKIVYPQLWTALKATPVDSLGGPVLGRAGYSVFRVVRREEGRLQSFDEARKRATASLVEKGKRLRFDAFVEQVRGDYKDQITIYPEHLEKALPVALLASSAPLP